MFQQQLRKIGNSYAVMIPQVEVERLGLKEEQLVTVEVHLTEPGHVMRPEIQEAFDESWKRSEPAYRYLGER